MASGADGGTMGGMAAPQTVPVEVPDVTEVPDLDKAWVTVVWNDPVNLMSYVTWVFQKLFGYSKEKAELLKGLNEDMDLRALLPKDEVKVGDEWDIEVSGLASVIAPGGERKIKPEE